METNQTNQVAESVQVRHELSKSGITVSRVYSSDFQKEGTMTAELKQTVTTKSYYPTKTVSNSLNANIFELSDFGFAEQEFTNNETRVAWIDVPLNSTVESVQAKINSMSNLSLYRILSNHPIIADTEQYAIDNPEMDMTVDTVANRQIVRYPADHTDTPLAIVKNNGKPQYRRIAFSIAGKEDVDMRTIDPSDFYVSPEINAELNAQGSVIESQRIG